MRRRGRYGRASAWKVALGCRRFLPIHAAVVERGGRVLVMTGRSGSGESTPAALLQARGWRLLADEFALIEPATVLVHPFPRPVSLKSRAIEVVSAALPGARWRSMLKGAPKGDVRRLVPAPPVVARMDEPAVPALILLPRYGPARARRAVGAGKAFVRLTRASINYPGLGEAGFDALLRLLRGAPAWAIDYPAAAAALAEVAELARWR